MNTSDRICGGCKHYNEPICAKLRPCEKSLPGCPDFYEPGKSVGKVRKDIAENIRKVVKEAFDIFNKPATYLPDSRYQRAEDQWPFRGHIYTPSNNVLVVNPEPKAGLPYCYLGLMRVAEKGKHIRDVKEMEGLVEITEPGYSRAEMCPCDWDFLRKIKSDKGITRVYAAKPKDSPTNMPLFNTVTNGLDIKYARTKALWKPIDAFGLFTEMKGGTAEWAFGLDETREILPEEHPSFFAGCVEIPIDIMMSMNHLEKTGE